MITLRLTCPPICHSLFYTTSLLLFPLFFIYNSIHSSSLSIYISALSLSLFLSHTHDPMTTSNNVNGCFGDTKLTKVFVGGLAWDTHKEAMYDHFIKYGDILEAVIISDKLTRRSKGYGFVCFVLSRLFSFFISLFALFLSHFVLKYVFDR